eukprot:TRINITY_DN1189_c0_g1_i2.p1 TRINITY_DN1189_c0_g1~~TRINITY_DN1189_c0_g1_i2.p1  ORF type:complete len:159 (-),score=28.44 TRINITY_DN1189_c0_g1_i2:164-640(-)
MINWPLFRYGIQRVKKGFRVLGNSFYRGADGCVLVFDVTVSKSFDNIDVWRNEFLVQANIPDPDHFPFIVVGNKVDLADERVVTSRVAQGWCTTHGNVPYFETSAKDSTNVDQAFHLAAKLALQRSPESEPVVPHPSSNPVDINKVKPTNQNNCCSYF